MKYLGNERRGYENVDKREDEKVRQGGLQEKAELKLSSFQGEDVKDYNEEERFTNSNRKKVHFHLTGFFCIRSEVSNSHHSKTDGNVLHF